MKTVNLVLRETQEVLIGDVTIGVDAGAWYCVKNAIPMLMAVGDFDSVTPLQFEAIEAETRVEVLPPIKDITDFEYALTRVDTYDRIYVYGALGGRLDHELNNLNLISKDVRIQVIDDAHHIYACDRGEHRIPNVYRYVSVFPLEDSVISEIGFKYPLSERFVTREDTYLTSNEVVGQEGTLLVHSGRVLFVGIKK